MIDKIINSNPDKPFIIDARSGRTFTYHETGKISGNIAAFLREKGFKPQDHIGLLCSNSPEFALLYFGAIKGRYVAVPVNHALPAADIEYILANSGLKAVFCNLEDGAVREKIPDGVTLFDLNDKEVYKEIFLRDRECASAWDPKEACAMFFTSGTTSRPKGVIHRGGSFFDAAAAFNKASGIDSRVRLLHILPMAYMAGFLNTIICPFMAGATVIICPAFNAFTPMNFWQPVFEYKANTFWMVPMMLASLLKIDRDLKAADYCRSNGCRVYAGTAPLPVWLKKDFEKRYGAEVYESYGLSETLFISANGPDIPYYEGSAGRPLDGVRLRTKDSGELLVSVPWLMEGYLGDTDKTGHGPDSWFSTGDIADISRREALFITGRCKDIIIRGGINLSPFAIEEKLMASGLFETVAVVGMPHRELGEEVVAAVVLKKDDMRDNAEEFCSSIFPSGYGPDRLAFLPELPLNSNGKISRSALKTRFGGRA